MVYIISNTYNTYVYYTVMLMCTLNRFNMHANNNMSAHRK